MSDFSRQRREMVERQVVARGVRSSLVLSAMREVPREAFLPHQLHEFAYEDSPLPIEAEQTISQPYIVAFMVEALELKGGEKVLEIGAGSGYAAAILSRIAGEVYTIERIGQLAEKAATRLADLGYSNVHVLHGDGTVGWAEHAPFDAIVVAAGGPSVPDSLKQQLKIGGRLVIPVGTDPRAQELVRVTRVSESEFRTEDIADVRFVPLIGEEGWLPEKGELASFARPRAIPTTQAEDLPRQIARHAEAFESIETADLAPLLRRIGDARVVLLGEASHGTSEFYRMRERITRELIEKKGFTFVAIEGDWPDAARIDHYVRHFEYSPKEWTAFARFPQWMWRNEEVRSFVDWLRQRNHGKPLHKRAAFYGLDIYSLYTSIGEVLAYLDKADPEAARVARERYGCLTPWQSDPAAYGEAMLSGGLATCEKDVVAMLKDILIKQNVYMAEGGEKYLNAVHNARLIASAEQYYRIMYYGSRASWNLRDTHMFETLNALLEHHGSASKAIVWAHNSHIGNASATEMSARGETNIGELCRSGLGNAAYAIGFGTDSGSVAAATHWDAPMEVKAVRTSHHASYERQCHESGVLRFALPLRAGDPNLKRALMKPRLERAIGVIYRPETELASHYFQAVLPDQFDEYIWFDRTHAVTPFEAKTIAGLPDTYPFGL
ncbi:MAG: protein-L-isoaspartate(D-aspartate) O-methyltransferase [Hyphomicrobiales bacterium]